MNVVITGASKGLGLAFAEIFAQGGHSLTLCARGAADLDKAASHLRTAYPGITVDAKPADLSKPDDAKAFGRWTLERGRPVDILINNAGRFVMGNVYDEPEGTLEEMMTTNVYSAYHLTRALLPPMMARRQGHIFNICSIASLQAYKYGGAYSVSKFALLGFSKNLREDMKPHGIKVTAVCPGAAWTASWDGSGVAPERIMKAEDVARMVYAAAMLSPQATVEDIIMRPQLGDL
ncbi:MAG TPA: SDR family NAD(P)-dependent oxidoreductase [Dinghuibacter sp.]|uniref:SDR family NAD(P)-dependent oxidoreductase n=1 Tax=Dinghuibacter sp. TaxID=2024697 RepID=UPI002D102DE3|nr:SDR family NAD(P)-dependent oxidoreductase [Dinghuibacter sp.]HTJ13430.1 SDR family NAD(P)-dependent oxidoreductase [Dinghuibacter sp.]